MTRPFRSYPVQYSIFKGTHFSISHPIHLLFSQAVFSISMQMFLATTMEKALNFLNGFQTNSQKTLKVAIKDHLDQFFFALKCIVLYKLNVKGGLIPKFFTFTTLQKKVPNQCPEHLLFSWIVLRIVILNLIS